MHISLLIQARQLFYLEKALLWILNTYFSQKQCAKVKSILMDLFLTNTQLIVSQDINWCGLLVDYCDVFISCLDSHSDGTHSRCWTRDVMPNSSKSFPMTKQTHLHLEWPEGTFSANFHIGVNYSFKNMMWHTEFEDTFCDLTVDLYGSYYGSKGGKTLGTKHAASTYANLTTNSSSVWLWNKEAEFIPLNCSSFGYKTKSLIAFLAAIQHGWQPKQRRAN